MRLANSRRGRRLVGVITRGRAVRCSGGVGQARSRAARPTGCICGHVPSLVTAELLDPGGGGHVDLRELPAHEVEPHEDETVLAEPWGDPLHDRELLGRDLGGVDAAAHVNVRPEIVVAWHAVDRAEHLAVEQQDALVPLTHRGQVLLHHDEPLTLGGVQIEDGAVVPVAGRDHHHSGAPRPVERLDHGGAPDLLHEGEDSRAVRRDERAGL